MRIASGILSTCILITAAGCAVVPQRYQLAAEPLMDVPGNKMTVVQPGSIPLLYTTVNLEPIDRVNLLVQDSQNKCAHFVNSMFAETAGSGFVLDVLSTATSAISTIFTPLATVHSLGAASTIFGAGKTAISANYLNTLSISHITQAIQSTYTSDMKKYIDSLASLDTEHQNAINVFQERSKIVSYHAECSLAAAEGSISGALQPPAQAGQQVSLTHTVVAGESTPALLAAAIAKDINGNSAFGKAGITASASGNVIALKMASGVVLDVTVSPVGHTETALYVAGPPGLLTITGTPRSGDQVTVTATLATPQPSAGAQPTGGAQTAPAAISGENPALK